jgi:hypothetical protein
MPAEPPVSFSTFLVSLASAALQHSADRAMAQHTLDLVDVLAAKTQGNLDAEEARLLSAIQDELRGALAKAPTG